MSTSIAKLAIMLTADTSGLAKGFAQARAQTQQFAGKPGGGGGMLGSMFSGSSAKAGMAAAAAAVAAATYQAVKHGSELAAQAENASVAFRVMIGDAERAKTLLADVRQFAIESPLGEGNLQQGAQTLLQFGMTAESIMPTLRTLGDIAMGDAERMERLTLAFAQVRAAGRLTGQDLLQMINAGFNPLQEISDATGLSLAELRRAMEDGAISAEMIAEAFRLATEEGGRFHKMNEEMLKTLEGQWKKAKDNFGELMRPWGELVNAGLKEILENFNNLFDRLVEIKSWLHNLPPPVAHLSQASKKALADLKKSVAEAYSPKGWDTEGFMGQLERFNKITMDLRERGQRFADQFRTPAQDYAAIVVEAKQLLDAQAISAELYARAIEKAKSDLKESESSAKAIREALAPRDVSASSRFSTEGVAEAYRARQEMQATQQADLEIQRRQLEADQQIAALTQRLLTAVERREEVRITEVHL